jgi:hypothetical protein
MEAPAAPDVPVAAPSIFRYVLGFLLIGLAWGFTTPFIRAAARTHKPPAHPILDTAAVKNSWLKGKLYGAFFGVVDLLRNPRYAVPLVINLTGSVWFFLLIGQAGKSSSLISGCMLRGWCESWCEMWLTNPRAQLDCSDYELNGVFIYRFGRVVGREEGYRQR